MILAIMKMSGGKENESTDPKYSDHINKEA